MAVKAGAMKLGRSIGIVDQVRVALSPEHRLPTAIGALLGAVVPVATFTVLHGEVVDSEWWTEPRSLIVVGGLLYSARTVYQWGRLAFGSWVKAFGFTVLLEGVMTLSRQPWLGGLALGYLCAINAIATGVTLARGVRVTESTGETAAVPAPATRTTKASNRRKAVKLAA